MAEAGYDALDLGGLDAWLAGRMPGVKPVVLTFDDGHISMIDFVLPVLKAMKLKAIFLASPGRVGKKEFMTTIQQVLH
jgi:peptidoglycan/xylan/chitin deacetylase (PgdA/CDA1 family)